MPRGERGGKKVQASKERSRAVAEGHREAGQAPTSSSGLERLARVEESVAIGATASKAPSVENPRVSTSVRSVPKSHSTAQPKTPPKGPPPKVPVAPTQSKAFVGPPNPPSGPPPGSVASQSVGSTAASSSGIDLSAASSSVADPAPASSSGCGSSSDTTGLEVVPFERTKRVREPEVPKAKAEVPKAKARLSDPIGESLRPQRPNIDSTAPVAGPNQEVKVRLSCDLHGCLDLDSFEEGVWATVSRSSLANWLSSSKYNQAGVYTFIGTRGPDSQERRNQAISETARFNSDYHTDLRILITVDREKNQLTPTNVSCHIDDKESICYLCHDRGLPVVCLNPGFKSRIRRGYQHQPPFPVVSTFQEAITQVRNFRLVPRVFASWPGIFKTG